MDPSYNNPFGSFGANSGQPTSSQSGAPMQTPVQPPVQPAPILSPVGGDIVLPSQPKKKKVGLIIGIVLIVIAIVAGVVAGVILLQKNDSANNMSRYFGLVTTGDDSNNDDIANGYDSSKLYYFEEVFYGDNCEEAVEYYRTLQGLLNKISQTVSDEDSEGKLLVNEQKGMLEMYILDCEIGEMDFDSDYQLYVSGGYDAISEKYYNKISSMQEYANSYVNDYKRNVMSYIDSLVSIANFNRDNGCTDMAQRGVVECQFSSEEIQEQADQYYGSVHESLRQAVDYIDSSVDYYIDLSFLLFEHEGV